MSEELERSVYEVYNGTDKDKSDNVRHKGLQKSETRAKHEGQLRLHKRYNVRPTKTEGGCKGRRGSWYECVHKWISMIINVEP